MSLNGIENGSIIGFSSKNLLTDDLVAIKYMRYLVLHIFTSYIVLTLAIYNTASLAFVFMYYPTEMCICNCLSHLYSFIKPEKIIIEKVSEVRL